MHGHILFVSHRIVLQLIVGTCCTVCRSVVPCGALNRILLCRQSADLYGMVWCGVEWCCAVLCCAVLSCVAPYRIASLAHPNLCFVPHSTLPRCTVVCCLVLHCIAWCRILLCGVVLHCSVLHFVVWPRIAMHSVLFFDDGGRRPRRC